MVTVWGNIVVVVHISLASDESIKSSILIVGVLHLHFSFLSASDLGDADLMLLEYANLTLSLVIILLRFHFSLSFDTSHLGRFRESPM